MEAANPRIALETTAQGMRAQVLGRWTAQSLAQPGQWQALQTSLQQLPANWRQYHWDVSQVQRLDHVGAQLLWNSWFHEWPEQLHASAGQRATLERVAQYTAVLPPTRRRTATANVLRLGERVQRHGERATDALRLLGQLWLDAVRLVRHPRHGPWRDISGHLYHVGTTALPITALVGFLIGVVLAYLMSQQLRQFGADAFIVNILGIAIIRELGPVLAAILIAGRSGSAITAQIGVMRVTEELDAMRIMGIPRGYRLVLPRALAMALAMPLLSVWTTLAALLGGMLASEWVMGLTPAYFVRAMSQVVLVSNLWLACAKSAVFGLLIALIGCHYGLRIQPNTQSLGEGTTASVVTAITMVLLVDALFAVVFKDIGL